VTCGRRRRFVPFLLMRHAAQRLPLGTPISRLAGFLRKYLNFASRSRQIQIRKGRRRQRCSGGRSFSSDIKRRAKRIPMRSLYCGKYSSSASELQSLVWQPQVRLSRRGRRRQRCSGGRSFSSDIRINARSALLCAAFVAASTGVPPRVVGKFKLGHYPKMSHDDQDDPPLLGGRNFISDIGFRQKGFSP